MKTLDEAWVSHGKRNQAPPVVEPKTAHDRLQRFIAMLVRQNPMVVDGTDAEDTNQSQEA
jgi:hypothetical protein